MRPSGEEILRGVQQSLLTYVLPEVQSAYARTELMVVLTLLGIVADEWDGAAQRLADDNDALRDLARRAADLGLADGLAAPAGKRDASLRISDLATTNDRLRAAIARLAPALEAGDSAPVRELRAAVIEHLRAEAESRSRALMGPRADG